MNIIFFHSNGIVPTLGGISRITYTLGKVFCNKNNAVWYVGARNEHHKCEYSRLQSFLPSENLFAEANIHYIVSLIKKYNVNVVINQCALDPRYAKFLRLCKDRTDFVLVSCIHNSILTPVLNAAYQKEYHLKKKGLGFVFSLMKSNFISTLLTYAYILKHRNNYLSTLHNSDRVLVLCDGQAKELYRMCGICSSNKVKVIHNCVETFDAANCNKKNIVLWVGTFDVSVKRPDNMLYIWKRVESIHPDWELKMLGDGPSFEEMKELANELNIKNVSFEGRVNPEIYYSEASILCVTSVHESFSLVTAEAQWAGCVPILNNSFAPAAMLVQNGLNGILVEPFDNSQFADSLLRLMENPNDLSKMAINAHRSASRFSTDVVYSDWVSMINDCIQDKNAQISHIPLG